MPRNGYLRCAPTIEPPQPDEPKLIEKIVTSFGRTKCVQFGANRTPSSGANLSLQVRSYGVRAAM
jgi:hypothetical protein